MMVSGEVRIRLKARRLKKFQEILKQSSLVLYKNTTDKPSLMAVATSRDFGDTLIEMRYADEPGQLKPWEPIRVKPKRTFTFAPTIQEARMAHTGTRQDLRVFLRDFVERNILVASLQEFTEAELDQILGVLFIEEKRLVVPFALSNSKEGEEQWKYYGHQGPMSFEVALKEALKS